MTETTSNEPAIDPRMGEVLRRSATHFVQRDWDYTRKYTIKHIRYADAYTGYHHPLARVRRVVKDLLHPNRGIWSWLADSYKDLSTPKRVLAWLQCQWATIHVGMRTDPRLPDGVLDGGSVITYWEETGEYLQLVQPSVGELVADFLIAEPDHPHAQRILAELTRIERGYAARCAAGEVAD